MRGAAKILLAQDWKGADGGALTRGLHHRRLTFVHTAASALIGGRYVGETACLSTICKVDRKCKKPERLTVRAFSSDVRKH